MSKLHTPATRLDVDIGHVVNNANVELYVKAGLSAFGAGRCYNTAQSADPASRDG
jgi:hypothetical protein